jgi:hypothetical protein
MRPVRAAIGFLDFWAVGHSAHDSTTGSPDVKCFAILFSFFYRKPKAGATP